MNGSSMRKKNKLVLLTTLNLLMAIGLIPVKVSAKERTNLIPNSPQALTRYSLEAYLPEIGDQGDVGSCVGWATTYYGLTIVKRIEHGKDYPVFSPLSTYNRYCFFYHKNPCYGGSQIDGSLEVIKHYGSPLYASYALQNCAYDPDKTKYKDRLFDYERLQHMNYQQIKAALSTNRPVVIGLNVYAGGKGNSMNTKFLDSNGIIKIENFGSDYAVAGHAMCIVGYDDNIGGGAFKLVNSWGKEWGKNGFCWLRYKDLKILRTAYSLIPNDLAQITAETAFKTKVLRVYNSTPTGYFIALGLTNAQGEQHRRGWYFIPPGETKDIVISKRNSNTVYYALMNENGSIYNQIPGNVSSNDGTHFFDYVTKTEEKNANILEYAALFPKNRKKIESLTITGSAIPKISD